MAIVKKKVITRKPGTLYYVDARGNLCSAPMKNRPKRKPKKRR